LYLPRIGQVENMSVEGLFVHGGDLWRLNTPLSCLQPPQQGKTLKYPVLRQVYFFTTPGFLNFPFFAASLKNRYPLS
ncbi:hypothetical protein, partial [Escherichia coli]